VKPVPLATTTSGRVSGRYRVDNSLVEFRGVPYAAPPVGELRWRAPERHTAWSYVRECNAYSAVAWQRGGERDFSSAVIGGLGLGAIRTRALLAAVKWAPVKESEDCLTLNIRAPADSDGLPVMFWLHGGDHSDGAASLVSYRSDSLPARGCVLVTANYRLGMFGFLAHPELAFETGDDSSGNFGLLDQIAALEWVRENIAQFGGDPDNVTVFGESAGGQAVLNLMSSSRSSGLFHQAIAQSPGDSGRWLELRSETDKFQSAMVAGAAYADACVGAGSGQLDRMRAMGAADLMQVYRARPDLGRHFFPSIGGTAMPESPYAAFAAARSAQIPLICGHNADEGSAFAEYLNPAGAEMDRPADGEIDMRVALATSHDPATVEQILEAYPGLADLEPGAVRKHLGDHMFGAHIEYVTRHHAANENNTYRYRFDAVPSSPKQTIGSFHGAELGPLFGVRPPLIDPGDGYEELSEDMGDRWVAFATTGIPDRADSPNWPHFDAASTIMTFNRPEAGEPSSSRVQVTETPGIKLLTARIDRLIGSE